MSTLASIARHPLHPMLVVFPISLWVFSFAADLIFFNTGEAMWREMALYTMAGGVIGAILAAIPGIMDLATMTDPEARTIGISHMLINLTVTLVFIANVIYRLNTWPTSTGPVWLSFLGLMGLALSVWLGNHLVYRYRIGVTGPRTLR